jgi:hypothetical protein
MSTNERTPQAQAMFEVLDALHRLAHAEMCSNPTNPAASSWRELANAIGAFIGYDHIPRATPVTEHQPLVLPPGFENPIPPKGGAQPVIDPSKITDKPADIRERPDVKAELDRLQRSRTGGT